MSKSITATIILSLLCLHNWNAAHAAAGPLDSIDSRLIHEKFVLDTEIEVAVESQNLGPEKIPGCTHIKKFEVYEGSSPGEIIVAICKEGELGPSNIKASLAKRVTEFKEMFKNAPAPMIETFLAGAEPVPVPLDGGKQGMAMTIPAAGHGLVLVPLAYAVTSRKDATIVVQAYLSPNNPRNLNKPMAALLQAIYSRLHQNKN